jgi:hypothetical protein
MRRGVGILLRCRYIQPNVSAGGRRRSGSSTGIHVSRHSGRQLHSTNRSYAANSGPAEKIDEAELARLLEEFEGTSAKQATEQTTDEPTQRKRKSKIEDYDAWHGWDGEIDRAPGTTTAGGSSVDTGVGESEGKSSEVDRYIRDVLSGVAESKAAREKAEEEVKAVQGQVEGGGDAPGRPSASDGIKEDISVEGKLDSIRQRSESAFSTSGKVAGTTPIAPPPSTTTPKPPFSKADMSLLAKKLQNRLDEEIRRLKNQKESVKQSLTLRAREFSKDAQVQFGLLGGKVNEVTGYNEIERLKQDVRERGEYVSSVFSAPQLLNV